MLINGLLGNIIANIEGNNPYQMDGWGRVSIRKTFAQFLRNETQNFSFFAHQFCAKKQQFAQSFAKVISRKIALFRFCETQVLPNSATRFLRNSAIS